MRRMSAIATGTSRELKMCKWCQVHLLYG